MARASAVAVTSALVVLVLGVLISQHWAPLVDLDQRIDSALHEWALTTPLAVAVARVLAVLGDTATSSLLAIAVVVLLLVVRRRRLALAVALTASLSPLVTRVVKVAVERPRPTWPLPLDVELDPSFPSGHATGGIAVWLVCGLTLSTLLTAGRWRVWLPFAVIGIAIGLSRPVLGVHWPSDVLGGWCVALAVGATAYAVLLAPRRIRESEPERRILDAP
jgi:membrane-associated phospholipid phosphatase